jgi:integrase
MSDDSRRARGTGSVREVKPNVWRIRVGCGRKADGTLRQKQETVHGTRAAAEYRAECLYKELRGDVVANSAYTLAQYYESVVIPSKARTSKANQDGYRYAWAHIPKHWANAELRELTQTEVQDWVDTLSPGTARSCVRYLRAILRQAYGDGLLKQQPMDYSVNMPKRTNQKDIWDEEDIADVLKLVRGLEIEPYILLVCGTGCRREEALARRWDDLEFDDDGTCWVTIDSTLTAEDGLQESTKTEQSLRHVPICGYIAARLKEIRGHGYLQHGSNGHALSVGGLRRRWNNLWRKGGHVRVNVERQDGILLANGIQYITPNACRHSHITLMSELGIRDRTNRKFHGHKANDIQGRHYVKRYNKRLLRAAVTVAEAIDEYM